MQFVNINDITDFLRVAFNSSQQMPQEYHFTYKGIEYDATDYAQKHPGGLSFLRNMKEIKKDFTQYFRALHSDQAEAILKSFKVIGQHEPTQSSQEYMEIYKKMEPYHQPLWSIEILFFFLLCSTWLLACTTSIPVVSVLAFGFTQILASWVGHSCAHSRNKNLNKFGAFEASLLGGFSLEWWSPKHNMHHMFTNITKFDEDIQHEYKVYLYPFLYLKWRYDSLQSAIKQRNYVDIALITLNYACLYYFRANFIYFILGDLIAGFYGAFVLIGNHEKQVRFKQNPERAFIDHQIIACRNYRHENLFWLLMMGGMQYQTEHHLFPQVPFYRLPNAKIVIKEELARLNKSMIYGPVI